jgi:hypothetical protein
MRPLDPFRTEDGMFRVLLAVLVVCAVAVAIVEIVRALA